MKQFACLICVWVLALPLSAQEIAPENFVEYIPGDIPLILEVPHDGRDAYPGVPERSNPGNEAGFNKGRDQNTSVVARNIQTAFLEKTGKKPYVVIMKLSRKWIDVNRQEVRAVEDEKVAQVYRHFYAKLKEAKAEIIARFGKGLILDIHCGSGWTYDVYFGTRGMKAIKPLIGRAGKEAFGGEFSIQKSLSDKGYEIPGYKSIPKEQGPTGNVIQALTWTDPANKLDGIEIEINSKRHLNKADAIRKFSGDLAEAVMLFFTKYYSE